MLANVHHSTVAADLLRAVWASDSVIAIAPIQEVLGLGTDARMNLPGTVGPHNWTWRLDGFPGSDQAAHLRTLNEETGRQATDRADSHPASN